MQITKIKKSFLLVIFTVIISSTVLFITGCSNNKASNNNEKIEVSDVTIPESNVLGEGDTKFVITVTDKDGNEENFEIHTDKTTVGEALLDLDFISGDNGQYGIYVKTVNGITVDYDKDGAYWAFYVNGEYATSGVDTINITEGDTYSFKVE